MKPCKTFPSLTRGVNDQGRSCRYSPAPSICWRRRVWYHNQLHPVSRLIVRCEELWISEVSSTIESHTTASTHYLVSTNTAYTSSADAADTDASVSVNASMLDPISVRGVCLHAGESLQTFAYPKATQRLTWMTQNRNAVNVATNACAIEPWSMNIRSPVKMSFLRMFNTHCVVRVEPQPRSAVCLEYVRQVWLTLLKICTRSSNIWVDNLWPGTRKLLEPARMERACVQNNKDQKSNSMMTHLLSALVR